MYSFVRDLKELSGCQSFSPTGLLSKTFRNKIDFFRCNQLPAIKEEEGISQCEIELKNIPSYSQFSNNESHKKVIKGDKAFSNDQNKTKKSTDEIRLKHENPLRSLPPLVNVNCLMNVNLKQEKPIWNTTFGKRLINGRSTTLETVSLPTVKNARTNDETLKQNQSSNLLNSSRSLRSDKSTVSAVQDIIVFSPQKKTDFVQVQKKPRKVKDREKSKRQKPSEIEKQNIACKSETNCTETSLRAESLTKSLTTSRTSRNQNFLSRCVQNILEGVTTDYKCEYCDKVFPNVENLNNHKNKHEREKQTCVLCNKVYYNPREFVQHLLTHESVDKFSCKKCKKYFPSLKKYKNHCQDVHLISLESDESKNVYSPEDTKELTPKYECKRCQLELNSEEDFRTHKRKHIRLDLMGAYLLSNKSI